MVLPIIFGIGIISVIVAAFLLLVGIGLLYESSGSSGAFGVVFVVIGILAAVFGVGLMFGGP